jgi:hypothetical protein
VAASDNKINERCCKLIQQKKINESGLGRIIKNLEEKNLVDKISYLNI